MLMIAERLAGKPGVPSGLPLILREIGDAVKAAESFTSRVDIIVGWNGRVPVEQGRASLTPLQALLCEALDARRLPLVASPADVPEGSVALGLGVRFYGRIVLEESPVLG